MAARTWLAANDRSPVLVRATSPGPGLFRQSRVGKNGVPFMLYKIRTMRVDAEPVGSRPVWAQARDPRATTLGRWLRDLHLDELPQLYNVLKGEMAIVGPRPERPEFVAVLKQQIADYEKRLDVLPGITGLAQLNLPPDCDVNSVRKKLELDKAYIREQSMLLDIKLILCTFVCLLGWRKESVVRWMRLDRAVRTNLETSIAYEPTDLAFWTIAIPEESVEHKILEPFDLSFQTSDSR
ncbi:MAG: sugar transferase [Pirellula staleyi]